MNSPNFSINRTNFAITTIAVSFVAGSLAYSLHAASFLHPKGAVFAAGAFILACLMQSPDMPNPSAGLRAFLPLWLYLMIGATVVVVRGTGIYPALEAALVLTPALLFASLARPFLTYGRVHRILLFGTVPVGMMALAQYLGWIDGLLPPVPTYTQRMYSVFGNQDLLGGFLAVGIVVAVQGILSRERIPVGALAALAVLLPAWMLAGSRTAWLAAAAGVVVTIAVTPPHSRRRLAGLGAAGIVLALFMVLLSPADTLDRVTGTFAADDEGGWFRLWFWDGALRMFASASLMGVGLGGFSLEAPRFLGEAFTQTAWLQHKSTELTVYHAHSDPLEALAETGLLGALLLGWMAWRLHRGRGGAWAPLCTLLVFACFNGTVISPPHAVAALMLMSCLIPVAPVAKSEEQAMQSGRLPAALGAGALLTMVLVALLVPSVQLRTAQTAHLAGEGSAEGYEAVRAYTALFPEAQASLGQWHAEQQSWSAAIAAYEYALLGLDTGRIHLELGALHFRTDNLEAARRHLEAATERWPWNADAWRLFIATLSGNEREEALAEAARWVSPEAVEAMDALSKAPSDQSAE